MQPAVASRAYGVGTVFASTSQGLRTLRLLTSCSPPLSSPVLPPASAHRDCPHRDKYHRKYDRRHHFSYQTLNMGSLKGGCCLPLIRALFERRPFPSERKRKRKRPGQAGAEEWRNLRRFFFAHRRWPSTASLSLEVSLTVGPWISH